jgi:hypothetical protein
MATDLTPVYYITATAASIGAVLGGARSYYSRQRSRWTDEGARATRQADAMEANTRGLAMVAAELKTISAKLDGFAEETRKEMRHLGGRLSRLEDIAGGGDQPHRSRWPPGHTDPP